MYHRDCLIAVWQFKFFKIFVSRWKEVLNLLIAGFNIDAEFRPSPAAIK